MTRRDPRWPDGAVDERTLFGALEAGHHRRGDFTLGESHDEIEGLLAIAYALETSASHVRPSEEFCSASAARLMAAIAEPRRDSRPAQSMRQERDWRQSVVVWIMRAAAALGALSAAGVATAHASSNALPDEPLYTIKQLGEQVSVQLASSDTARAEILLDQADVRLNETLRLNALGRGAAVADTLQRYDAAVLRAKALLENGNVANDAVVAERVESMLEAQQALLREIQVEVPVADSWIVDEAEADTGVALVLAEQCSPRPAPTSTPAQPRSTVAAAPAVMPTQASQVRTGGDIAPNEPQPVYDAHPDLDSGPPVAIAQLPAPRVVRKEPTATQDMPPVQPVETPSDSSDPGAGGGPQRHGVTPSGSNDPAAVAAQPTAPAAANQVSPGPNAARPTTSAAPKANGPTMQPTAVAASPTQTSAKAGLPPSVANPAQTGAPAPAAPGQQTGNSANGSPGAASSAAPDNAGNAGGGSAQTPGNSETATSQRPKASPAPSDQATSNPLAQSVAPGPPAAKPQPPVAPNNSAPSPNADPKNGSAKHP
jgi:hypothetical protein